MSRLLDELSDDADRGDGGTVRCACGWDIPCDDEDPAADVYCPSCGRSVPVPAARPSELPLRDETDTITTALPDYSSPEPTGPLATDVTTRRR